MVFSEYVRNRSENSALRRTNHGLSTILNANKHILIIN